MPPTPTATVSVPLDSIRIPDSARRADPGLVASVRENGLLHPVGVQKAADGSFSVVYGCRRVAAARACHLDAIPALVFPADLSPADVRILSLVENLTHADLTPLQAGDVFVELLGLGVPQAEIARKICRPLSYVANRLAVASFSPQARTFLEGIGHYSVSACALLARLPPSRLMEVLERNPETATSVSAARDALRECPRLDAAPFARDCGACEHRDDAGNGETVCLAPECFGEKMAAHVGDEIAGIRATPSHRLAPLYVEKTVFDFASAADRQLFKAHGAQPLRDKRLADGGEEGGEAAILLGRGGEVRPVHVVPVERQRDGRASRHDPANAAAVRARAVAVQVADRLARRLATGPRPIDGLDLGELERFRK